MVSKTRVPRPLGSVPTCPAERRIGATVAAALVALVLATPLWAEQRVQFGGTVDSDAPARSTAGSDPAHFAFEGPGPAAQAHSVQGDAPFRFWIDEEPGNYRVTLTLGGDAASDTTVKAELRRVMLRDVRVPAGGTRRVSFVVNVRTPEIAGGGAVRLKAPRETTQEATAWDRRLSLEFNGVRPAVRAISVQRVDVPTIYLLGDSTVTDQSGEPYASWGQMLTALFGPTVAIANHSESGESVAAANDRGRFAKILGEIRPGDVFVVQFGHNDMKDKQRDPQAAQKYRDGLIAWAQAVRAKGATAVIVTPMNRHTFQNGKVVNTLEDYPEMARAAAAASGARLIDLNARSATLYEAFGDEPSLALFKHDADGSNRDATHHSPFGAWELARIVAPELARVGPAFAAALKPDYRRFDPAHPDRIADFTVPPSPGRPAARPLGDDAFKAAPAPTAPVAPAAAPASPPPAPQPTGGPNPQPTPPRQTIALPGGKAKASPPGPFQPTWDSLKANYRTPDWFIDAKFGIFLHFGAYTVAAHASEWYPRHMYSNAGVIAWHAAHFGAQDTVGYKDLIARFKAEHFDPDAWADLFARAGARVVIPTAEHHDGFALYDSALTRWDAVEMGPHRDIIGDLGKAVRAKRMKFGISNHRIENWDFMYPVAGLKTDLFDPAYADLYGPPQPHAKAGAQPAGEMVVDPAAPQSEAFLEEWLARAEEIVDKYKPDLVYFDNGINPRRLDPWKLRFAAYYYNSAHAWGKPVTLNTKSDAYLYGTVTDYERQGRAPKALQAAAWSTDDPIGDKFGYVEGMGLMSSGTIVQRIVQDVARGGTYLLNISPMADGTIPAAQQKILLEIGAWLRANGEAIYGTRQWTTDADGTVFYTKKGDTLFATALSWPTEPLVLPSVPLNVGKVTGVTLLGNGRPLAFRQNDQGLIVAFPAEPVGTSAYALRIEGLNLG